MGRSSAVMALSVAASLVGCAESGYEPIPVPDEPDLRDFESSEWWPCNVTSGTVALHSSLDTLDLDYGAVIFWVYEQDSVNWVGDFPQTGTLAFRGYNIHRVGFPQVFDLCMPPGRYTVRAVQDRNHNGRVCEIGEIWGTIDLVHPVADPDETLLVLDSVLSEEDGCPSEETGLPSNPQN